MRVPRVRVHGGDDPVRRDPLRDPPGPRTVRVGRVGDELNVLPGDQCEQPDRVRRRTLERQLPGFLHGRDRGQHREGVAHQSIDELLAGRRIVPGNLRLARAPACPERIAAAATSCSSPGRVRATRRTAATSCVTVSCVATASSSTMESSARRVFPPHRPVHGHQLPHRLEHPVRPLGAGQPAPPIRQRRRVERRRAHRHPHAAFHRKSNVTASAASRSDNRATPAAPALSPPPAPADSAAPAPRGTDR